MAEEQKPKKRVFIYDSREFPDPDPKLSVDEVRQNMANFFPELSNADTKDLGDRKVPNSEEVEHLWEYKKRVGTKGRFHLPGATGPGVDSKVDTRPIVKECRLGFCAVKGSVYAGGDEDVKEKLEKGVCPICGGELREKKNT